MGSNMHDEVCYLIAALRERLLNHPVYMEVASGDDLRGFMEGHVFAVWDFMSLLKRQQHYLNCTNVLWFPAVIARPVWLINYIVRKIEIDGDSHGPMGRELIEGLVADSPQRDERAMRAACNSIKARIELWNGTLSTLREMRAA